jgi:hypothetical protein
MKPSLMHILVNLKSNWLGFLLRTAPCCSISWDVPTWGLTTGWLQMPVLRCGCLSVWEKQKDVRVRILITMQCQPQTSSVCCQVPPYQYNRSKAITLAIVCTLCQQLGGGVPNSNFGVLWHQQDCFLGFLLKRFAT